MHFRDINSALFFFWVYLSFILFTFFDHLFMIDGVFNGSVNSILNGSVVFTRLSSCTSIGTKTISVSHAVTLMFFP